MDGIARGAAGKRIEPKKPRCLSRSRMSRSSSSWSDRVFLWLLLGRELFGEVGSSRALEVARWNVRIAVAERAERPPRVTVRLRVARKALSAEADSDLACGAGEGAAVPSDSLFFLASAASLASLATACHTSTASVRFLDRKAFRASAHPCKPSCSLLSRLCRMVTGLGASGVSAIPAISSRSSMSSISPSEAGSTLALILVQAARV